MNERIDVNNRKKAINRILHSDNPGKALGEYMAKLSSTIKDSDNELSRIFKDIANQINNPLAEKIRKTKSLPSSLKHIPSINKLPISRQNIGLAGSIDGWVILNKNNDIDEALLDKCEGKDQFELNDIISNFYHKNGYQMVFNKIDELLQLTTITNDIFINNGQKLQLRLIVKFLKENPNSYPILISTIMSIVENFAAQKIHKLNTKQGAYIKKNINNTTSKSGNQEIGKTDETNIFIIFIILSYLWDEKRQNFADGPDKVGIGRHSIAHGRVNPLRYTSDLMIKLILLMYGLVKIPALIEFEN